MIPFSKEDEHVAKLAISLSLACGFNSKMAGLIGDAAALHDCGKVKVPEYIINKPGRLSLDEMEIMKTHTIWGAYILSELREELRMIAVNIVAFHHEKWDGSGYWGYRGGVIPYYCQIVSICDMYVALTANRPYKEPWPPSEAMEYIKSNAGKTFCPKLVRTFLGCYQLQFAQVFNLSQRDPLTEKSQSFIMESVEVKQLKIQDERMSIP
ncbi:MAG: HD domain-containing protein [Defluviitaleaceae bacterium]|nr:HD domain-containing protein [Defluviitaleaceae bacterium]MCL2274116.1 HD domain-containing protein [Defluviitaleaceae bacterium]